MTECVRKISCIVCPMSCVGTVTIDNGQIKDIQGFTCQRGLAYAREEVTAPKRMLTTTVRVSGGVLPLVPVASKISMPKEKIVECARALTHVTVEAPVLEGEVVCHNILGLGVDIVATRDLLAQD